MYHILHVIFGLFCLLMVLRSLVIARLAQQRAEMMETMQAFFDTQASLEASDAEIRTETARVRAMAEESLRNSRECLRRSNEFLDGASKRRTRH